MPLRDDYAMFGYGIMFNEEDEDLVYEILESVGKEFDTQHIPERIFLYYKPCKMCVGSRLGTFSEERKDRFYPPMNTIQYNGVKYPLKFYLHMW
jgi:hypothetical protein